MAPPDERSTTGSLYVQVQNALIEVDTNDVHASLRATEEIYNDLYFGSGAYVEIELTAAKIHAVAFAALAAAALVASAWYVSPQTFDMQRFTEGVGEMRCFDLLLDEPEGVRRFGLGQ